jgi:integrase
MPFAREFARCDGAVSHFLTHARSYYRKVRSRKPTREADNYASILRRWQTFVGDDSPTTSWQAITVRAWLDQLAAEQLSRNYINACLTKLRIFCRWLADQGHAPDTLPFELSKVRKLRPGRSPAKEPQKREPQLTLEQVVHFARKHLPQMQRDIVLLMCFTGARPCEILNLTSHQIIVEPGFTHIRLEEHKTTHQGQPARLIPLNDSAIAIIERYLMMFNKHEPLFIANTNKNRTSAAARPYSIEGLRQIIRRRTKALNLDLQLYDIRRLVAIKIRQIAGLDAAQAMLGHAQQSTTEIYCPINSSTPALLNARAAIDLGVK